MSGPASQWSAQAPAPGIPPLVWAVIPARYASTRFPGKPLVPLAGKPMIQHVVERTRRTPGVSRVLVATDDERIRQAVLAFGGEAVLTGEHPTGTDRIHEAVQRESARRQAPHYVLNVQGDEPLVSPDDLQALIAGLLALPQGRLGTLVHALRSEEEARDPNVVKAVLDGQGRALYFSRAPIPYPRGPVWPGQRAPLGWRHLGVYLFRTDFLATFARLPRSPLSEREQLEQLRALEHGFPIHCFEAQALGLGVDSPEQVPQVEALLRAGG
ncbi:MAG TPA: 3-deoxy-manno-octulosonate cytidylyltransferase [bacterium]|nr:3-deoxy-manno-octulosonate cytidylyltransferase [bacterium]